MSARLLLGFLSPALTQAATWGVIAAGSNGWSNYRHQADACHAYQILKEKGIPEENIIVMMYDDVAKDHENPIPGKIFNAPDAHGLGRDVYAGCKIDYRGKDVSPEKYLSVITGEGDGRVLKSTEEDYVFLNFINHGAPGLISFPDDVLHKDQLQKAFAKMAEKKMFRHLAFYLETCESGSMFEGLNVPGVYAVSAANPYQPSYGAYCSMADSVINGTSLHTCLGDLFSVTWMADAEGKDTGSETLSTQYENVAAKVTKSKVMQWGDKAVANDTAANYFGSKGSGLQFARPMEILSAVPSTQINLHLLYERYTDTWHSATRLKTGLDLQARIKEQSAAEAAYWRLAQIAYPDDEKAQHEARTLRRNPDYMQCELEGHRAIQKHCKDKFQANSAFALQFHQVVVNICYDIAVKGMNLAIGGAAELACGKQTEVVV